jgi:transcriptional regulator with XRE-family HTH domain
MFSPTRLTVARKRRRLTKKDLAEAVGLTAHAILRYESGENVPTDEVIDRLTARILLSTGNRRSPGNGRQLPGSEHRLR